MNNKLPSKINDYVRYASISQQHYKGVLYSDSALNCRKACEAICKVVIYNTYSEKLADTKVEYCNLKDLITLVIKDGLAERKVINWLESLQIIGNKAAHDNVITKEEANYSLHALNLLTDWLFKDYLKINLPKVLLNIEPETITPKETSVIEKIIVQEKISQETEDNLVNRVQSIIEEKNKDNDTQTKLDADTISEIKKSLEETNKKINTINASKTQADKEVLEIQPKPKSYKRLSLISVIIAAISCISIYLLTSNKNKLLLELPITKHHDTIYVAVNDLKILQDNPNINFKIESILQTYLDAIVSKTNLPIKITHTNFKQSDFINDTTIINHAVKLGYDIIYFGNLYETALTDSNILDIKGSLCKSADRIFRSHKVNFKNLTDSTLVKELNDQANLTAFYFARQPENLTKAIEALDKLNYYSAENYNCALNITLQLNFKSKNHKGCLNALNKLIPISPPSAYYMGFKGGMFLQLKMFDSSVIYSKKALLIDSNYVSSLSNLGETYLALNSFTLAETNFLKALQRKPNDELANMNLALLYNLTGKPQLSKNYAFKTHQINPENVNAMFVLAENYALENNDSAEYYYNMVIKKDSSFVMALNSLGNYYQKHYPKRNIEAKNLFIKANQINNTNQLSNIYGLGISAFAEKDYQQCINFLEQAYKRNMFNNEVSKCLTISYFALGNLPKAFVYAKKGMEYDSTNISNQYNYAVLLTHMEKDNVNKVCYYFNKALKNNSKDLQTSKEYAQYLSDHQKYKEAISIALPFYKINITDVKLNKLLAFAHVAIADYKSAINYSEFLNIAEPNDFEAKKQLAFLILNVYMGNKEQFARGSGFIKRAIEINPNNAEAHVLYAYYMTTMTSITKQQNMPDQTLKCKNIAREQYLLAKTLDSRMYDKYLEDFIKY